MNWADTTYHSLLRIAVLTTALTFVYPQYRTHPREWTTSHIMKPAKRRAQNTQQPKIDRAPDTSAIRALMNEGSAHLQDGRFQEAERAYRGALDMAPNHPDALHHNHMFEHKCFQSHQPHMNVSFNHLSV